MASWARGHATGGPRRLLPRRRRLHTLPWPSVTELSRLRLRTLHTDLADLANLHGPVFGLPLGDLKAFVVGDAELAEHVLSPRCAGRAFGYRWEDHQHLPFASWGHLLGASQRKTETAGIFFGNGPEHWAPPRRACERGLLHGRAVRKVGEQAAEKAAASLAEQWARRGGGPTELHGDIRESTLQVVTRVAFGSDDALGEAGGRELRTIYSRMTGALEELAGVPSGWWWALRRTANQELRSSAARLRVLLLPILEQRRHELQQGQGAQQCIVDLLLESTDLPDSAVLHNALQLLGAGHDTTATSLALLLWHLAQDSALQEEVRQEVLRSGGGAAAEAQPLLSACVQEVLRLWPAAPVIVRQALEPAPPWMGIELPLGSVALVAPWLLGRSAALWDCPELFNPRRFLAGDSTSPQPPHQFAWLPFGYGVRSCVGQHLAVAELRAFTAALLRRLRFSHLAPPAVEWFLTLRLREGLQLHIEVL